MRHKLQLFNRPILGLAAQTLVDLVNFCTAAASVLLGALCGDSGDSGDSGRVAEKNENSILHPEQINLQQKTVLAGKHACCCCKTSLNHFSFIRIALTCPIPFPAVPEYIVDDLMTALIFIAKNRADLLSLPQVRSHAPR